jgi:hypothetical protein
VAAFDSEDLLMSLSMSLHEERRELCSVFLQCVVHFDAGGVEEGRGLTIRSLLSRLQDVEKWIGGVSRTVQLDIVQKARDLAKTMSPTDLSLYRSGM